MLMPKIEQKGAKWAVTETTNLDQEDGVHNLLPFGWVARFPWCHVDGLNFCIIVKSYVQGYIPELKQRDYSRCLLLTIAYKSLTTALVL